MAFIRVRIDFGDNASYISIIADICIVLTFHDAHVLVQSIEFEMQTATCIV